MSERYNYLEQVTADAKEAILEHMDEWEFENREELEERRITMTKAEAEEKFNIKIVEDKNR